MRTLRDEGLLREAWSPGGPGAILVFDGERDDIEAGLASLPLIKSGLIDTELIELHEFPGFA